MKFDFFSEFILARSRINVPTATEDSNNFLMYSNTLGFIQVYFIMYILHWALCTLFNGPYSQFNTF